MGCSCSVTSTDVVSFAGTSTRSLPDPPSFAGAVVVSSPDEASTIVESLWLDSPAPLSASAELEVAGGVGRAEGTARVSSAEVVSTMGATTEGGWGWTGDGSIGTEGRAGVEERFKNSNSSP